MKSTTLIIVAFMCIVLGGFTAVTVMAINGASTDTLILAILGIVSGMGTALLGLIQRNQQTTTTALVEQHKNTNSRLTELVDTTQKLGQAQGREQERESDAQRLVGPIEPPPSET